MHRSSVVGDGSEGGQNRCMQSRTSVTEDGARSRPGRHIQSHFGTPRRSNFSTCAILSTARKKTSHQTSEETHITIGFVLQPSIVETTRARSHTIIMRTMLVGPTTANLDNDYTIGIVYTTTFQVSGLVIWAHRLRVLSRRVSLSIIIPLRTSKQQKQASRRPRRSLYHSTFMLLATGFARVDSQFNQDALTAVSSQTVPMSQMGICNKSELEESAWFGLRPSRFGRVRQLFPFII